jgi:hypothetical protein
MRRLIASGAIAAALLAAGLLYHLYGAGSAPYAGFETRRIKALSDAQLDELREGRGMGYALAAELNDFPGPRHVLDFGEKLALSADQRREAHRLYDAMLQEAKRGGATLVAREVDLDRLFRSGQPTEAALSRAVAEAAAAEGRLRFVHLKYHLATRALLSSEQRASYRDLRGYAGHASGHSGHGS